MIDLHSHILPGVDDGPRDLQESLKLARAYVEDGVTVVTATPHCHRLIHLLRADVLPHVQAFNQELKGAGIPLTVLPGSEIQVYDSTIYRREFEDDVFCHLGDRKTFTLLEFNWSVDLFPRDAAELVEWIRRQGMIPIVAHPERHVFFREQPELVRPLVEAGAWLQITVDSLIGNFGPEANAFAEQFLRTYPEAILASDAHNTKRCSGLSRGYQWVREHLGDKRADDLFDRAEVVRASLLSEPVS
ncbi:tyrosine-protein phosphatase [Schlesneria sp. T3-172]|uniref:tyrosine-protein phosphatase n=1 Tax=Schlesneria sphaerica TaxID=3373610 RepID=UPI0037CAF392